MAELISYSDHPPMLPCLRIIQPVLLSLLYRQRKLRRVPTLVETGGRTGYRNRVRARRRARAATPNSGWRATPTAGCQEYQSRKHYADQKATKQFLLSRRSAKSHTKECHTANGQEHGIENSRMVGLRRGQGRSRSSSTDRECRLAIRD